LQVKEECIASLTDEKLSAAAAIDMLQLRLIASTQDVSCVRDVLLAMHGFGIYYTFSINFCIYFLLLAMHVLGRIWSVFTCVELNPADACCRSAC
jgi:hypothetical protein